MMIDGSKCVGCSKCVTYCPIGCMSIVDKVAVIDDEACVECGVCMRNSGCPTDAIGPSELVYPRLVRRSFSDPYARHTNTKHLHGGRGTEEIKTNDVTGVVHSLDKVEIGIEMGRPGIGAYFFDVEIICKAVAKFGVEFAHENPLTTYMTNLETGEFDPELLNEKVLSCIIEFETDTEKLLPILDAVKEASEKVQTVFSVCVICKVDDNNKTIVETKIAEAGYNIREASSKTNMGLGRPLYEDRIKGGEAI